jgi:hypothetical protein
VVIDIGATADRWAVIEANAARASGCYHADPDGLLDVVHRAALPQAESSTGTSHSCDQSMTQACAQRPTLPLTARSLSGWQTSTTADARSRGPK